MARYFNADILIEIIKNDCMEQSYYSKKDAIDCVECMPTADVVEVKRGKWITDESEVVICSECGEEHYWQEFRASFCDNCGADMRGETE